MQVAAVPLQVAHTELQEVHVAEVLPTKEKVAPVHGLQVFPEREYMATQLVQVVPAPVHVWQGEVQAWQEALPTGLKKPELQATHVFPVLSSWLTAHAVQTAGPP